MIQIELQDVASDDKYSIVDGPFGSSLKTSDYVEDGIPVLQGKNITGDKFIFSDIRFISLKKAEELKRSKVVVGDYLLVKIGSIGYLARIDNLGNYPFAIIPANLAKIKIDESKIDHEYFRQVFKQPFIKRNLFALASKTAQPALSLGKIKSFKIPVPDSLEDQIRVANILGKAEALISQRKESLRLLDELLKSTFLEMFGDPVRNEKGWEIKRLKDLVTKLGDGLHGTPEYASDGEYYFINGNNLNNGKIQIYESTKRVSKAEYLKHRKELNETSILVSINGTLGRVAFYSGEKIVLGKSACYFNLILNIINQTYLFHLLTSDYFLNYAQSQSTGSTIRNVSLKTMREFPVPNPPLKLQAQFSHIVEKIEGLKAHYQTSLQELEKLYGSLSQRAFRGELGFKESI